MGSVIRLSTLRTGDTAIIEGFEAGKGLRHRLLAMGIVPGEPVHIVRAGGSGPVVVRVKDSRVMLGRGMANKILVSIEERTLTTSDEIKTEKVHG